MPTDRDALRGRLDQATAHLDPPLAVVDLTAFDANARALTARAAGKPVRLATKSVRCRALTARALATPGWRGLMAYSLAEAVWLARWLTSTGVDADVLVAYPTVDRAALAELAADADLAGAVTLMIDDEAQLAFVEAVVPAPAARPELRVCLDLDASWRPAAGRVHVGVRRSPLHSPADVARLARTVAARRGFRLVGLMAYEAQIAGVGDAPGNLPVHLAGAAPGRASARLRGALIGAMQRRSYRDLLARRGEAVAAARAHADLEFVNGGGTGSVAASSADPAVTEVTAGSGLYGPTLFDGYRAWRPTPAAFFALPVVRRPARDVVTVSGGGWIASGPAGADRLPVPWLPAGLRLRRAEGAGEVQTPLAGPTATGLRIGDRVWFRHAKAGELCEHVGALHLVDDAGTVITQPTYRGEGNAFLG